MRAAGALRPDPPAPPAIDGHDAGVVAGALSYAVQAALDFACKGSVRGGRKRLLVGVVRLLESTVKALEIAAQRMRACVVSMALRSIARLRAGVQQRRDMTFGFGMGCELLRTVGSVEPARSRLIGEARLAPLTREQLGAVTSGSGRANASPASSNSLPCCRRHARLGPFAS